MFLRAGELLSLMAGASPELHDRHRILTSQGSPQLVYVDTKESGDNSGLYVIAAVLTIVFLATFLLTLDKLCDKKPAESQAEPQKLWIIDMCKRIAAFAPPFFQGICDLFFLCFILSAWLNIVVTLILTAYAPAATLAIDEATFQFSATCAVICLTIVFARFFAWLFKDIADWFYLSCTWMPFESQNAAEISHSYVTVKLESFTNLLLLAGVITIFLCIFILAFAAGVVRQDLDITSVVVLGLAVPVYLLTGLTISVILWVVLTPQKSGNKNSGVGPKSGIEEAVDESGTKNPTHSHDQLARGKEKEDDDTVHILEDIENHMASSKSGSKNEGTKSSNKESTQPERKVKEGGAITEDPPRRAFFQVGGEVVDYDGTNSKHKSTQGTEKENDCNLIKSMLFQSCIISLTAIVVFWTAVTRSSGVTSFIGYSIRHIIFVGAVRFCCFTVPIRCFFGLYTVYVDFCRDNICQTLGYHDICTNYARRVSSVIFQVFGDGLLLVLIIFACIFWAAVHSASQPSVSIFVRVTAFLATFCVSTLFILSSRRNIVAVYKWETASIANEPTNGPRNSSCPNIGMMRKVYAGSCCLSVSLSFVVLLLTLGWVFTLKKQLANLDPSGVINTREYGSEFAVKATSYPPYYICQHTWLNSKLNIYDLALFAKQSYVEQAHVKSDFLNVGYQNWTLEALKSASSRVKVYRFNNNYTKDDILVVRGSSNNADWAQNFDIWGESLVFQITLGLFLSPPAQPIQQVSDFVYATAFTERTVANRDKYYEPVVTELNYLRESKGAAYNSTTLVIGHSLGGGIAKISGVKTDTNAIGFNAPGLLYASKKLGLSTDRINALVINVRSTFDIVSAIDRQGGNIQNIRCTVAGDTNADFLQCHSILNQASELQKNCDFKSETIITAET